jgi:hypothetical protein
MWASASSSPATAAKTADMADRRKSPTATEARRQPAARHRGGRGRAPPQESERPRHRHHREPCGLPAGPSGDGEGGRRGWWLAVAAREALPESPKEGATRGPPQKTDLKIYLRTDISLPNIKARIVFVPKICPSREPRKNRVNRCLRCQTGGKSDEKMSGPVKKIEPEPGYKTEYTSPRPSKARGPPPKAERA